MKPVVHGAKSENEFGGQVQPNAQSKAAGTASAFTSELLYEFSPGTAQRRPADDHLLSRLRTAFFAAA